MRSPEYEVPDGLSPRSAALWRHVVPKRARSIGRVALVEEALRSLDRASEARALVDAEGMTSKTQTTGAIHVHPAVRIERESRQLFTRIWGILGLEWTSAIDGRMTRDEDED